MSGRVPTGRLVNRADNALIVSRRGRLRRREEEHLVGISR